MGYLRRFRASMAEAGDPFVTLTRQADDSVLAV